MNHAKSTKMRTSCVKSSSILMLTLGGSKNMSWIRLVNGVWEREVAFSTEVQNLEPIGSLELKVHTKKVVSSKFGHVPFLLLNPFNIMKEA